MVVPRRVQRFKKEVVALIELIAIVAGSFARNFIIMFGKSGW
jgi:hypothetical protein